MNKKFKDLTGMRFGRLFVLGLAVGSPTNGASFMVKCDCGKEFRIGSSNILNGRSKSCGCLRNENRLRIQEEFTTKAKERIGKQGVLNTPQGSVGFNNVYQGYITNALRNKRSFDLSKEDFAKISKMNCNYCDLEPSQTPKIGKHPDTIAHNSYYYNGIDRINNEIGYVLENVVPCCYICNYAKRDMSKQEWEDYLERLTTAQIKRKTKI